MWWLPISVLYYPLDVVLVDVIISIVVNVAVIVSVVKGFCFERYCLLLLLLPLFVVVLLSLPCC